MSMLSPECDDELPAIAKLEGAPNARDTDELSLWRKFLVVIWPFTRRGGKWAKYGYGLSKKYVEAEVENKRCQAARTAAEAAEISARADANRNQAAKFFNEQIDNIFQDDSLPEPAKVLKLAKLLQSNPDLLENVDRVQTLLEALRLQHGTSVEIQAGLRLPPNDSDVSAT